jgi:hypothetical protein
MRLPLILVITLIILQIACDAYLFFTIWHRAKKLIWAKVQIWESAFFLLYIAVFLCLPKRTDGNGMLLAQMWMLFGYFTIYIPKFIYVLFDLIASIPKMSASGKRWKSFSRAGVTLAVISFVAMWWGALINRYRTQVNEVTVQIENLPQSFAGYRIAQISDLHVGTYGNDTTFVHRLVQEVNELNPDLIVFTGDVVNRTSDELIPFVAPLSRLRARDGVLSILGNHDYGDYFEWSSPSAKERNLERLMDMQIEMGWELLTNSTTTIYGDTPGDSINVIGVENWGDKPFPVYGDLKQAYPTLADSTVKILLTHNPAHWTAEIADADTAKVDLTLSGHTHAMQIELAGISPAVWRYKTWGGRYDSPDGKRPLYVNIGAGTVGIPMRLGATPEITVFTLIPDKSTKNYNHK